MPLRPRPLTASKGATIELADVGDLSMEFAGERITLPTQTFPDLLHVIDGVTYVNDSKGTNLGALRRALEASPRRVILIAGGRDKGGDYGELADVVAAKVREAVLIGEAAPLMEASWGKIVRCRRAATMPAAVRKAASIAKPGETVLLSPACSSFDMFRDYSERGNAFRQAVAALKEAGE